ncbi:hypothetical protein AGMMS49525_01260 [Bacteroidia bacterium]|nr:hypothetical protein AGMMS49525_01260 [Bacteroidia bacterium]
MKHIIKLVFSALLLAVAVGSCRDDIPELNRPADYESPSAVAMFEGFWTGMNNNYVFWAHDPTDWDQIYREYKPKFEALDDAVSEERMNMDAAVQEIRTYFIEMTTNLIDGHYALMFGDLLGGSGFSPSGARHAKEPGYHTGDNMIDYIYNDLSTHYLKPGALRGQAIFQDDVFGAVTGKLDVPGKNIPYFWLSGFRLTALLFLAEPLTDYKDTNPVDVVRSFFNTILQEPNVDGIVIDVRSNGGGMTTDLDILMGSILVGKPFTYGSNRTKMGDGRLDFGPEVPLVVQPYANLQKDVDESKKFPTNPHPTTKPIVVLADVNSVSCAELTTMGIASLPNGYFVGERTWGGHGALYNNERASVWKNAGEFSTLHLKLVYTPFQQFTYQDGQVYEGTGFPPRPELEVKYDGAALATGKDKQLEKAIEVILSAQ